MGARCRHLPATAAMSSVSTFLKSRFGGSVYGSGNPPRAIFTSADVFCIEVHVCGNTDEGKVERGPAHELEVGAVACRERNGNTGHDVSRCDATGRRACKKCLHGTGSLTGRPGDVRLRGEPMMVGPCPPKDCADQVSTDRRSGAHLRGRHDARCAQSGVGLFDD
jgi:hypothetical protein